MKRACFAIAMTAVLAATGAHAGVPIGGYRSLPPPPPMVGPPGGFGGFWIYDQPEVTVIEREVVREVPAPPPAPPPTPREPYVLGKSYASLPGGCMKMLSGSASYFNCGGLWYRQVGSAGASRYVAVEMP